MKKVLLYCICWLSAGTAAAQAVDGITGASTRVLAPADTSFVVRLPKSRDNTSDRTSMDRRDTVEVDSAGGTFAGETPAPPVAPSAGKKQARKRLVTVQAEVPEPSPKKGRLTIGGYGEATMKRCFYSNNYLRYTSPENYVNDQYGEFDIPHVVIYLGYDFGKGWSSSGYRNPSIPTPICAWV